MATTSPAAPKALYFYDSALSGRNIRLLQFEAGSGEDPIRCSLVVKPLDNNIVYNALSYSWGEPKPTREIICDDQCLEIGENLYDALWQLRQDGRTQPLWVDAVCINQTDNGEKTEQVRMMRDIYEQAIMVIAWLGKEVDTDEEGFSLMRQIYEDFSSPSLMDISSSVFTTLDRLGLPAVDDVKWKALCKILYRPYFFRVWIIQEILVGKRCIIQCGTNVVDRSVIFEIGAIAEKFYHIKETMKVNIPIDDGVAGVYDDMTMDSLRDVFLRLADGPSRESLQFYNSYSVLDLWFLKAKLDFGAPLTILQLLTNARVFKATEPRDKIFALVGLASNVSSDFVNYSESLAEVQIKLAKVCMQEGECRGPMFLSFVDRHHHLDELPSWVPDWTSGGPAQASLASSFYKGRPLIHQPQNWHFTTNAEVAIPGKIFDEVASIVHETPYMVPTPIQRKLSVMVSHVHEMDVWNDACWALVEGLTSYPTRENVFEAYWRTLIFNTESPGSEPSKELEFAYKTWISFYITSDELFETLKSQAQAPENIVNPESSSIWGRVRGYITKISSEWQHLTTYAKVQSSINIMNQQQKAGQPFDKAFKQYSFGRKFCITANGYIGWVPFEAQSNDHVCYFQGCKLPFIIRACEGGYQLVGDCYLHGLMHDPPPGLDMNTLETIILT